MRKIGLTLATFVVVVAPAAHAKPLTQDVEYLRVAYPTARGVQVDAYAFEKMPLADKLKVVHPDVGPNPGHTSSEWAGRFVKSFLAETKHEFSPNADVVLVGSDNYEAQLSAGVVMSEDVLLAVARDGERLPWMKGGNYTVFGAATKDPRYLRPGYWVWQLTAILIGELPPTLQVRNENTKNVLDLRTIAGRTERLGRRSISVGIRDRAMPGAEQIKLGILSLHDLAVAAGAPKAKLLSFGTYNGWHFDVDPSKDSYEAIFAWDGAAIPAAFGGPVQLCAKAPPFDCKFFVSTVEVK